MNIIITGANQGIGYYMVHELLKRGNQVTVLDLEIDKLEILKQQYMDSLFPIVCNVKDEIAMKSAIDVSIEKFKTVDIAIHNACLCTFESMEDSDYNIYKEVFEVNYMGALRLSKCVVPYMEKANSGKIIFTSSGVGVMGFTNISPYASSKGAIESLAKCLNIEHQSKGISYHIFHPPLTRTKSASPLPVPEEFKALPDKVGYGLAKNIHKKSFIICHSFCQKLQTMICYLFPIKMGMLMSKMISNQFKN